jgi:hypothetical protein
MFGSDEIARLAGHRWPAAFPEALEPAVFPAFIITHPASWSNEFETEDRSTVNRPWHKKGRNYNV